MDDWRWKRCVTVLREYEDYDSYIKAIEEQLRVPFKEEDLNSDIKGTRTDNDTMFNTLWTIETHKALTQFKHNKAVVKKLLNECGEDTETIIKELYIRKFPQYTLNGLVQKNILNCGRNKAIELRKKFFVELDNKLNG